MYLCVCMRASVCVSACVRVCECVRACVCVCARARVRACVNKTNHIAAESFYWGENENEFDSSNGNTGSFRGGEVGVLHRTLNAV